MSVYKNTYVPFGKVALRIWHHPRMWWVGYTSYPLTGRHAIDLGPISFYFGTMYPRRSKL